MKKVIAFCLIMTLVINLFPKNMQASENRTENIDEIEITNSDSIQTGNTEENQRKKEAVNPQSNTKFLYRHLEDGTVEITGYSGTITGDFVIPASIDGYAVSGIGESAFENGTISGDVKVSEGIKRIGKRAFYRCKLGGKKVILPESLERIEDQGLMFTKGQEDVYADLIMKKLPAYISETAVFEGNFYLSGKDGMRVGEQYQECGRAGCLMLSSPVIKEWKSSNPNVAIADNQGMITAAAPGTVEITAIAYNGKKDSEKITVVEKGAEVKKGDITWFIPERIKLGYEFRDSMLRLDDSGIAAAKVESLSEADIGKYMTVHYQPSKMFSSPLIRAVTPDMMITSDIAYPKFSGFYAVQPGKMTLQIEMRDPTELDGQGAWKSEKIGEPYEVIIEEPVIVTNEPTQITVGDSLILKSELQNTDLKNESVKECKDKLGNDNYYFSCKLTYEPQFIIESGSECIERSNGDFSHTLTASEKLRFVKSGTVKIKVRYQNLKIPDTAPEINGMLDFYCPEKTITIQVSDQSAHEHTGQWKTIKAPTCTEKGLKEKICTVCGEKETEDIPATGQHKYGAWKTEKASTCATTGKQARTCTVCSKKEEKEIPAAGKHNYGPWKVKKQPTCMQAGEKIRTCEVCGSAEKGTVAKLKPFIKLNTKTIPLRVRQSITAVKVSYARGDKIASWKSSNKRIAAVSKKGKITGKKTGTAIITVKLKSGKSAKVKVKVQSKPVTTSKLKAAPKNIKLKVKGRKRLSVTVSPLTSKQKVTYASTNKKVATVSKKGLITAKKPGKAKIVVKSGKKKAVCTVTVKR